MILRDLLKLKPVVLDLEQNSPRWLEYRRTRRTASETPSVLGLSPWTSPAQLARRKYSNVPEESGENRATQHGHEQEPFARKLYEKMSGIKMVPMCVERHLFMASLDGWSKDRKVIGEYKSPWTGKNSDTWKAAEMGMVPDHYYAQLMHQLLVTGSERADFFVYDAYSQTGLLVPVERNEEYFERILTAWGQFEKKYA